MKKILLIGDLVAFGKIALSSMTQILPAMEINTSILPTALVSNTFDYEIVSMKDTTDFMEETAEVWEKLDLQFDMIITGFVTNSRQVEIIKKIIGFQKRKPYIITDPIMGDDGSLYYGLTDEIVGNMKEISQVSDLLIPNLTEAFLLMDKPYKDSYDESDILSYLKILSNGQKSVLFTSVSLEDKYYVYGIEKGKIFRTEYEQVPFKFAGTGDIFTSLIAGSLMDGHTLEEATYFATKNITAVLKKQTTSSSKKVHEVEVERLLKLLT